MRTFGVTVLIAMLAGTALADAPAQSLRPHARPAAEAPAAGPGAAPLASIRPEARPRAATTVAAAPAEMADAAPRMSFIAATPARRAGIMPPMLKPRARPDGEEQLVPVTALRTRPGAALVQPRRGSVCGDPSIRGEALSRIGSRVNGCGVPDPVRVTQIGGVRLSTPATIDCTTARALKSWIDRGLRPVAASEPVRLEIAGSYVCRTRNHQRGAKVSEHGRGKAIDISGITFANGKTVSIARDYRREKMLKAAHRSACGIFKTTLGPGSDGFHEDHLHFDTATRGGTYCR